MKKQPRYSAKEIQHITDLYTESGGEWPATARHIAEWAINKGLWRPQPFSPIDILAEQIARGMRDEYFPDGRGRMVRAKHVARVEQNNEQVQLWADIRTASRRHMESAFMNRRDQIVGDCRQLKIDVDWYNGHANPEPNRPIQMEFDFTYDLREIEALEAVSAP